jgi:hypothetical protein
MRASLFPRLPLIREADFRIFGVRSRTGRGGKSMQHYRINGSVCLVVKGTTTICGVSLPVGPCRPTADPVSCIDCEAVIEIASAYWIAQRSGPRAEEKGR